MPASDVIMYPCRPCSRLHACVSLHPPVVTFFLCLTLLSTTFLFYGLYIQTHDVRDADVTQDWNMFLLAFTSLNACLYGNDTGAAASPGLAGRVPDLSKNPAELVASVSILVALNLLPWNKIGNLSGLEVSVTGRQLGLRGPSIDANVTVTLLPVESLGVCNVTSMDCPVKACVSVTGPRSLLPLSRAPMHCPMGNLSSAELLHLQARKPENPAAGCYRVGYDHDPTLETTIPQEERSLCSARLITSALSLFLVAVGLALISCFWFQPSKDKRTLGHL